MFSNFQVEADALPPLVLAYIGDAVYELYVRTKLVENQVVKVQRLHQMAVEYVQAGSQAASAHAWEPLLTEKEKEIMRRGRNVKGGVPRSASVADYRHSTGFEALIGYLYLVGRQARLKELLALVGPKKKGGG